MLPVKTGMFDPQVAAQDPYQAAAYAQATDPTYGLGAYQPYAAKAATAADAAGALTGPMTQAQRTAYMSPYQQDVIDATMTEFDQQAQMRANEQAAAALGTPGAYGGGREGVQRAQYMNQGAMNRANLQAQLLNQGFTQANQLAQQDMMTRQGLGTYMDQMGQAQQAYDQATKDAATMAAREAEFEPYTRLGLIGQQLAQIQPGAFPTTTVGYQQSAAPASPMASFLGGAAGAGGILGKLGIFG